MPKPAQIGGTLRPVGLSRRYTLHGVVYVQGKLHAVISPAHSPAALRCVPCKRSGGGYIPHGYTCATAVPRAHGR